MPPTWMRLVLRAVSRTGRRVCVVVTAAVLSLSMTPTLTQGQAGSSRLDPAADLPAFVRRGMPGAGHAAVASLAGTWRVRYEVYGTLGRSGNEPPIVSDDIRTRREWVGDGRFLEDTTEGTLMGAPYWRKGWLGYNNMERRFEWVTIDAVNSALMTYAAAPSSALSLPIIMTGLFTDQGVAGEESAGKRVGMKTVIHIDGNERHRIDLYFTRPGKKETLAVRAVYSRTAN
jgi:hypothetical protein